MYRTQRRGVRAAAAAAGSSIDEPSQQPILIKTEKQQQQHQAQSINSSSPLSSGSLLSSSSAAAAIENPRSVSKQKQRRPLFSGSAAGGGGGGSTRQRRGGGAFFPGGAGARGSVIVRSLARCVFCFGWMDLVFLIAVGICVWEILLREFPLLHDNNNYSPAAATTTSSSNNNNINIHHVHTNNNHYHYYFSSSSSNNNPNQKKSRRRYHRSHYRLVPPPEEDDETENLYEPKKIVSETGVVDSSSFLSTTAAQEGKRIRSSDQIVIPFRGTQDCKSFYQAWKTNQPKGIEQNTVKEEEEEDGKDENDVKSEEENEEGKNWKANHPSPSLPTLCQVYFPMVVESTNLAPISSGDMTSKTTSITCREQEFCIQTIRSSNESECQRLPSTDEAATTTERNCNQPFPEKRNNAALIRPLFFDGATDDAQKLPNNVDIHKDKNNNIGQMLVLSEGLNQVGNSLLAEQVVMHLPGLVLDPFRRYAKAHTKIKSKILTHAFETMDKNLYEDNRELWTIGDVSTLIVLQYQSSIFFASAGCSSHTRCRYPVVGFVAYWDPELGRATIVESISLQQENSQVVETLENLVSYSMDGVVQKDPDTGISEISLKSDPGAGVLTTSRLIGGGRFKLRIGGITASPVIQEVDLADWLTGNNKGNEKGQSNEAAVDEDPEEAVVEEENDEENEEPSPSPMKNFFVVAASSHIVSTTLSEQAIADRIGKAMFFFTASPFLEEEEEDHGTTEWNLRRQIKQILQETRESLSSRPVEGRINERRDFPDQRTLVASRIVL